MVSCNSELKLFEIKVYKFMKNTKTQHMAQTKLKENIMTF